MSEPWADFMAARMRLVHAWAKQGKSEEVIAADLNHHDPGQIRLLLMTPADAPIPGSVYEERKAPMSVEPSWLVKDFNVLYRAAKRFADACRGGGEDEGRPYPAQLNLEAQLHRLAEAFQFTESERREPREAADELQKEASS